MEVTFLELKEFIGSKIIESTKDYTTAAKVKGFNDLAEGQVYIEHSRAKFYPRGEYTNDSVYDFVYLNLKNAVLSENDTVLSCRDGEDSILLIKEESSIYQFTPSY